MQVWDWGGIALYTMLSVLNAVWFGRICSMIGRGLQKRRASVPGTPAREKTAQRQKGFDEKAEELVAEKGIKGAADLLQMQERRPLNGIKALH